MEPEKIIIRISFSFKVLVKSFVMSLIPLLQFLKLVKICFCVYLKKLILSVKLCTIQGLYHVVRFFMLTCILNPNFMFRVKTRKINILYRVGDVFLKTALIISSEIF